MRKVALLPIVLAAACGGSKTPAEEPGNHAAGDTEPEGPQAVEITVTTTAVPGSEALGATIRDAAMHDFQIDGSFVTEGEAFAYTVAASLEALTVTPGTPGTVACSLKITLMTAPGMEMFGVLNGSATVEAPPGEEAAASNDCVSAVVDDLVSKKALPALEDRQAEK